jgi:hypothetical protein
LPADQIEFLRDLVRQEHQRFGKPFLILAPKPNLHASVVITAWQMQLKLGKLPTTKVRGLFPGATH